MLVTVGGGQATNAEGAPWGQGPGQHEMYRWQSAWMTENRPWFQVHVKGKEEGATEHIVLAPPVAGIRNLVPEPMFRDGDRRPDAGEPALVESLGVLAHGSGPRYLLRRNVRQETAKGHSL